MRTSDVAPQGSPSVARTGPGLLARLRSVALENTPYKVLSVLISLALWFIVRDERVEDTLAVSLEIEPGPDLVVATESVPELSVVVSGTRPALDRLRRSSLVHAVRLKTGEPGLLTVRVRPEDVDLSPGVEASRVSPSSVAIRLESRVVRRVPVRPRLVLEELGTFRVRSASTEPARVRVSGPSSVVGGIDEVWTEAIPVSTKSGEPLVGTFSLSLPHRQIRLEEARAVTVRVEFEPARSAAPGDRKPAKVRASAGGP